MIKPPFGGFFLPVKLYLTKAKRGGLLPFLPLNDLEVERINPV
jgi:hypothetical protein